MGQGNGKWNTGLMRTQGWVIVVYMWPSRWKSLFVVFFILSFYFVASLVFLMICFTWILDSNPSASPILKYTGAHNPVTND